MEAYAPSFPTQTPSTWGGQALAMPLKERKTSAKGYLMSFPILASDPKSTGILVWDGEEHHAAMAETG